MNIETEIFHIISHGGDAKSIAYEALELAYNGDFDLANKKMEEANQTLTKAHNTQTKLIQAEINGGKVEMSLLMVHAQDHLMAAISEMSLIEQMIKILNRVDQLEKKQGESV
ncbi:PTS lactose/cellobiose transporter subunit IIA [Virgibacillus proomii]|jgi:cellobiose PTS system EIIA component|uniref:PTS lactose/cellobiose transporter subunit IIA n=1 Tax=Virgibacillus proomii TaxID=84407 RepID=UPI00098420E7|nr:PTS lactose/cellobiose transporter subunit IIA [Virgibacillus proomii]